MRQNSLNHRRIFNAGNDLNLPGAPLAGLDVNIEHPFEPLHPGHRHMALRRHLVLPALPGGLTPLAPPAPPRRRDTHTKLAIWCEHPMKEMGHKRGKLPQLLAKLTLIPCCYGHFLVEHNRGHHVNVATPEDPASARLGESFWQFLPRTVIGGLLSAWTLEKKIAKEAAAHLALE
jgi:hypothetical protein